MERIFQYCGIFQYAGKCGYNHRISVLCLCVRQLWYKRSLLRSLFRLRKKRSVLAGGLGNHKRLQLWIHSGKQCKRKDLVAEPMVVFLTEWFFKRTGRLWAANLHALPDTYQTGVYQLYLLADELQ